MLSYKVAVTFESVDETLKCDHSIESSTSTMVLFVMQYKVV